MKNNKYKKYYLLLFICIICLVIILMCLAYYISNTNKDSNFKNNEIKKREQYELKEENYEINFNIEEQPETEEENEINIETVVNPNIEEENYVEENLDAKFIHYYQGDYAEVPWCGGNVADSGSAVTCIAMIFTNMLQKQITPEISATWCKPTDYYVKYQGMSLAYINAATSYFNRATKSSIKCIKTDNINEVYSAVKDGGMCISLQNKGIFTESCHFIVLSRTI